MKDKDITTEIENGGNIITVTIIPSYIYDHMVKKYVFCTKQYVVCNNQYDIVSDVMLCHLNYANFMLGNRNVLL